MSNLKVAFTFFTVSALMRFWMAEKTAEDLRLVDSEGFSEDDMARMRGGGEGRSIEGRSGQVSTQQHLADDGVAFFE